VKKISAKFITLEGIDGAGKSSHLEWLAQLLRSCGREVVVTREPGGTPLGEQLRELLLHQQMHAETEALLMFAARREHLDKVILPALARGAWVVCDRFTDASFAYQCGGRGISESRLRVLEDWVQQGFQPDLTLLFDVPLEVGRARLLASRGPEGDTDKPALDRFELEQETFFQRVREMYLKRAAESPARIRVIDSGRPIPEIRATLEELLLSI
jgi:dTMP kinase